MIIRTTTGTLTAVADVVTLDVSDVDDVSFSFTAGVVTTTIVFEVMIDPLGAATTWTPFAMVDYSSTNTTTAVISIAAAAAAITSSLHGSVVSACKVRARMSAGAGPVSVVANTGRVGRS